MPPLPCPGTITAACTCSLRRRHAGRRPAGTRLAVPATPNVPWLITAACTCSLRRRHAGSGREGHGGQGVCGAHRVHCGARAAAQAGAAVPILHRAQLQRGGLRCALTFLAPPHRRALAGSPGQEPCSPSPPASRFLPLPCITVAACRRLASAGGQVPGGFFRSWHCLALPCLGPILTCHPAGCPSPLVLPCSPLLFLPTFPSPGGHTR